MWLKYIVKWSEIVSQFKKTWLEVVTHIYVLICLSRQTADPKWRHSDFLVHLYALDCMVVIATGILQYLLH